MSNSDGSFIPSGKTFQLKLNFCLLSRRMGINPIVGLFSNSGVKDCVELSVNQVFLAEQLLSSYYGGQVSTTGSYGGSFHQ